MAYLDQTLTMVMPNNFTWPPTEGAAANTWPLWEQQTPQYPQPSVYNLAIEGYRKNEIIYALIRKRMAAVSTAPARVYLEGDVDEEQQDHDLRALLRRPNPYLTEKQFWQYEACYKDIAGFSAWEIEFNNVGDPVGLWPMLPHWCSFLRGDRTPLRAIRYQPYGLPPLDIPRERLLFFQDIDPLFPFIRGLSRSAVALRVTSQDNQTTDFLKLFFQRGANMAGVLSVAQSLQNPEAERLRAQWRQQHGGVQNWADIAVLGNGATFQQTQMNMQQMQFDAIDARAEGRACSVFDVPPILLNAKISMGAATFHNYEESRKAWYQGSVSDEWEYLASELTEQLLPLYGDADYNKMLVRFDTRRVRALQEDRNARWQRAGAAFKDGLTTRDQSREEMELDPIDGDELVFASGAPGVGGEKDEEPTTTLPPQFGAPQGLPVMPFGAPDTTQPAAPVTAEDAAKALERSQFRRFAAKRAKEGRPEQAGEFKFRHVGAQEQRALLASVAMLTEQDRIGELAAAVRDATAALRETA